jgi:hypothetical protein
MQRSMAISALAAGASALALSMTGVPANASHSTSSGWDIRPVITNLNEPRGLSFDGRGALYVAQAGVPNYSNFVVHNGGFTKFRWAHGALERAWSRSFASIVVSEGGGTDVLGPAAISATSNQCTTERSYRWRACRVQAIIGESELGVKAAAGVDVPDLGHLYTLRRHTGATVGSVNVGNQNYRWTDRHKSLFPDDFPDSNSYGVLTVRAGHGADGARIFVADAGANTISEITRGGRSRIIAYIPNETSGALRDATPTCIALGPDGMLYVGALDLLSNFAAGSGQSNVWRVDPNSTDWRHNATIWATGFTTIDGCTFDRQGRFWASELFYPNDSGPPGDLAMSTWAHPSAITHIGGGQVPLPGGIAQGPDGAMYVSVGVADTTPHSGGVMRVSSP